MFYHYPEPNGWETDRTDDITTKVTEVFDRLMSREDSLLRSRTVPEIRVNPSLFTLKELVWKNKNDLKWLA